MKRILAVLLCAAMLMALFPLAVFASGEKTALKFLVPDGDYPSDDELFSAYAYNCFEPENTASTWGISARARLNTYGQKLYDELKEIIVLVADGGSSDTSYEISGKELGTWGVTYRFSSFSYDTDTALDALVAEIDLSAVLDALLADCPYELYWFDKLTGLGYGASYSGSFGTLTVSSFMIVFAVVEEYQSESYSLDSPSADTSKTKAASASAANAAAIVEKYAGLDDYAKIIAYRDEICSLVSYNDDAASAGDGVYGDPWQLIYVFDGDSSTNVVCEGYAKAFKHLCDISDFNSSVVSCYTVTGVSVYNGSSTGHMWNILTMPDGKNYLVDVTNSDTGSVGSKGGLFLNGVSGSIANGYTAPLTKTVGYAYYDDEKSLWGTDSDSILNLSSSDYDSDKDYVIALVTDGREITYDGGSAELSDMDYSVETNMSDSAYSVSAQWFADGNGIMGASLSEAPSDVGTYWVKITVTDNSDSANSHSDYGSFTIIPAPLKVIGASVDDKIYDGTVSATVTGIALSGIYNADDVSADLSGIDAVFGSADAGAKTKVTVSGLALTGTDSDNYYLDNSSYTVSLDEVYITKAKGPSAPTVTGASEISAQNSRKYCYTVEKIDGAEYKMDDGEWQDSNVFDLIAPETSHVFYARIKESTNYTSGEAGSVSVVFGKIIAVDTSVPEESDVFSEEDSSAPVVDESSEPMEGSGEDENSVSDTSGPESSAGPEVSRPDTSSPETSVTDTSEPNISDEPELTGYNITFTVTGNGIVDVYKSEGDVYICSIVSDGSSDMTQTINTSSVIKFSVTPVNADETALVMLTEPERIYHDGCYYINPTGNSSVTVSFVADTSAPETDDSSAPDEDEVSTPGDESAPPMENKPNPPVEDEDGYILGDINGNGAIDSLDYILLKRAFFNTFVLTDEQSRIGDINQNGEIDSLDYILLKRAYFGTYKINR